MSTSRPKLVVGAACVLASVLVAFFALEATGKEEGGGDGGDRERIGSAERTDTARRPSASSPGAETRANASPSRQSPRQLSDAAAIRIAGPERREGETAVQYKGRLLVARRFEWFNNKANPTPQQQQALLAILFDAQQNYDQLREAIHHTDSEGFRVSFRSGSDQIDDEVFARAAEILDEQQMTLLQKYMPSPSFLMSTYPLERSP